MHKRAKILIAEGFVSLFVGIKLGDMFTVHVIKILEKISVFMSAGQVDAIFLNNNTFSRILTVLLGIVFCTFGLNIGLLVDRITTKKI